MGACRDIPLRVTADQVRAELKSLAKRGLVDLVDDAPIWSAELTPEGEAVVDYRADCPPDIARPPRW
jgi:Mn-dependent DtxR family transcriptional regulator